MKNTHLDTEATTSRMSVDSMDNQLFIRNHYNKYCVSLSLATLRFSETAESILNKPRSELVRQLIDAMIEFPSDGDWISLVKRDLEFINTEFSDKYLDRDYA